MIYKAFDSEKSPLWQTFIYIMHVIVVYYRLQPNNTIKAVLQKQLREKMGASPQSSGVSCVSSSSGPGSNLGEGGLPSSNAFIQLWDLSSHRPGHKSGRECGSICLESTHSKGCQENVW